MAQHFHGKEAMVRHQQHVRGVDESRVHGAWPARYHCGSNRALYCSTDRRRIVLKVRRAQHVDLGFNPDHLLLVTIDPSLRGYSNEERKFS